MSTMAVRIGGDQRLNKYYYGNSFQRPLPSYRTPIPLGPQFAYTLYPQANYPLIDFSAYQQVVNPSNNMPDPPQQDVKEYFFDLGCPELTGGDSTASPAASSLASGTSYAPPSPSLDAKDLMLVEHGVSIYSPTTGLSPLSNFGDNCFNAESCTVWPEQPVIPSCNQTSQVSSDGWSYSQQLSTQPFCEVTSGPADTVPQPHLDTLYTPSTFQDLPQAVGPHMSSATSSSLNQSVPMGFIGWGEDGLVAPGYLFNTSLDRCTFSDPSTTLFPGQSSSGSALQVTPHMEADVELMLEPAQPTERSIPELARNTKDEYLQEARRRGLSYKEIKRRGGFTEAESTLRGRIRILSKPKEMRVRKPQWHRADILLLCEAVECFSEASPSSSSRKTSTRHSSNTSKLPWKKVAEWMLEHGASYPFAGATCAKKWEQIRDMSF